MVVKKSNTLPHVWHTPNTRITEIEKRENDHIWGSKGCNRQPGQQGLQVGNKGLKTPNTNIPATAEPPQGLQQTARGSKGCKWAIRGCKEQQGAETPNTIFRRRQSRRKGCNRQPGAARAYNFFKNAEFDIKKEAAWAMSNATSGRSHEQIQLARLTKKQDELNGAINVYAQTVDESEGLDKIENLQTHGNDEIYEKAVKILERYWAEEDEEESSRRHRQKSTGF
ncbi:importin alpha isoform 4 [Actinidia rufa]|uniref:Importin alpha isoform 4 n=1 Tax=Actinidia rufa TaxID=165716 RepID=A0A7J0D949_9ERIC|nr:importin alpha isoform 4 [Actinidia rufa]